MSSIARWSYKNVATIRPFLGMDTWTNEPQYGEEFEIACNWIAKSEQARADNGAEFVSRHVIYCEDARPKYLDLALLNGETVWEEIRARTNWDMALFNDTNDYMLVT